MVIPGLTVTREPGLFTMKSTFERRQGLMIAAGGVGIIVAGIAYLVTTGPIGAVLAMTLGILITWLGTLFVSPHVIRVDRTEVSAGRTRGSRRNAIPLLALARIETGAVNAANERPTYYVRAVSGSLPNMLLFTTRSKELADHVARIVGDAVATMPTTSSPDTA